MNKHLIAITAAAALAGCAVQPTAQQAAGEDLNGGIAKTCSSTPVDIAAPGATSTITMTNDGWCAVRLKDKDGRPFQLGLLTARPQYGRVLIQKAGGETRIEYTPENRHVGSDRFTVALRTATPNVPDLAVQVLVNVTMGENMAPPPAPAPATPAPATRRSSTRSR